MEILIGKLLEFGTVPSLLVLTFVVALMVKKIEENGKKDESRNLELRTFMSAEMNALEDRFEARFVVTDKRVEELSTRISCVERDYLPREEHYKEFSGWRAEINRLSDLIINIFKEKK